MPKTSGGTRTRGPETIESSQRKKILRKRAIAKFNNGGRVERFDNGKYNKVDYQDIKKIALQKAKETGAIIQIMPEIDSISDPDYKKLFGDLLGTRYQAKCPDLKIIRTKKKGKKRQSFIEYESYTTSPSLKKVEKMIARGADQSDRIIVDIRQTGATKKGVRDRVIKLLRQKTFEKPISRVWVYDGNKTYLAYKK